MPAYGLVDLNVLFASLAVPVLVISRVKDGDGVPIPTSPLFVTTNGVPSGLLVSSTRIAFPVPRCVTLNAVVLDETSIMLFDTEELIYDAVSAVVALLIVPKNEPVNEPVAEPLKLITRGSG